MADRPRFGPAGIPPLFRTMGAKLPDVPTLLHEEGLDAFEYQAVQWGQKPQMKQENAEALGYEAKKSDVLLSVHGSYYVNFAGEKDVVEASKRRLIACATAAKWMDAYVVVFHAGFYGHRKPEALKNCIDALKDTVEKMQQLGIDKVKLGPETMGKHAQIGALDEILTICEEVPQTQLVIDWSHMHARDKGRFQKVSDFRNVAEKVEERLGTEAIRNVHCHFTRIEFTDKGERCHHILDEREYGPEFEMLAEVVVEFGMRPVIICETPILDIDAMKMRDTLKEIARKHNQQN